MKNKDKEIYEEEINEIRKEYDDILMEDINNLYKMGDDTNKNLDENGNIHVNASLSGESNKVMEEHALENYEFYLSYGNFLIRFLM